MYNIPWSSDPEGTPKTVAVTFFQKEGVKNSFPPSGIPKGGDACDVVYAARRRRCLWK